MGFHFKPLSAFPQRVPLTAEIRDIGSVPNATAHSAARETERELAQRAAAAEAAMRRLNRDGSPRARKE